MKKIFQDLKSEVQVAKERLKEAIRNLPDTADGVKRLGHNCGVVRSNDVFKHGYILSPHYWLTCQLKRDLIEYIDSNRDVPATINCIEDILKTGIFVGSAGRQNSRLHPSIVKELKKAWEGG